jgi:hypothetical protein
MKEGQVGDSSRRTRPDSALQVIGMSEWTMVITGHPHGHRGVHVPYLNDLSLYFWVKLAGFLRKYG